MQKLRRTRAAFFAMAAQTSGAISDGANTGQLSRFGRHPEIAADGCAAIGEPGARRQWFQSRLHGESDPGCGVSPVGMNAKSRSAAKRLGFRFEGIFFGNMVSKGRNRDTAWYSILDAEWPGLKSTIEAWLDPSNFEVEGKQLQSLSVMTAPR